MGRSPRFAMPKFIGRSDYCGAADRDYCTNAQCTSCLFRVLSSLSNSNDNRNRNDIEPITVGYIIILYCSCGFYRLQYVFDVHNIRL